MDQSKQPFFKWTKWSNKPDLQIQTKTGKTFSLTLFKITWKKRGNSTLTLSTQTFSQRKTIQPNTCVQLNADFLKAKATIALSPQKEHDAMDKTAAILVSPLFPRFKPLGHTPNSLWLSGGYKRQAHQSLSFNSVRISQPERPTIFSVGKPTSKKQPNRTVRQRHLLYKNID